MPTKRRVAGAGAQKGHSARTNPRRLLWDTFKELGPGRPATVRELEKGTGLGRSFLGTLCRQLERRGRIRRIQLPKGKGDAWVLIASPS